MSTPEAQAAFIMLGLGVVAAGILWNILRKK